MILECALNGDGPGVELVRIEDRKLLIKLDARHDDDRRFVDRGLDDLYDARGGSTVLTMLLTLNDDDRALEAVDRETVLTIADSFGRYKSGISVDDDINDCRR